MLALVAATIIIVLTRNYEQYTLAQETQRVLGFGDRQAELRAVCEERCYTEEECTAWMLTQAMDVDLTPAPGVPPAPREGLPPLPGRPKHRSYTAVLLDSGLKPTVWLGLFSKLRNSYLC
jgi:hypothetical protein